MAIKQADKDKLKALGIDPDKLIEAAKAEAEVDVDLPTEVTVIKNADLQVRDANNVETGKKTGETEGEKKGRELAAKAFKKKFGLDDKLPNDPDKIVEAVSTTLAKGDEALKQQVDALLKDKDALIQEKQTLQQTAKAAQLESRLIGMFPTKRGADLKDTERLALLRMDLQIEEVDGKEIVKRNGQIVQDPNTHSPLPVDKVINDYFTERKWVAAAGPGGRGTDDKPPPGGGGAGIKSMTKFTEAWKAENPGLNDISPEFDAALAKHVKEVPDFNYYE